MQAKLSFTPACAKLGHSYTKNNFCLFMTIELSQLMLNLDVVIRTGPFSRHAVDMHCQWEYYNLYEFF